MCQGEIASRNAATRPATSPRTTLPTRHVSHTPSTPNRKGGNRRVRGVGKVVLGDVAGLVAAFLLAISPWHMFASGEARYWALVYALTALGYRALLQAEQADRAKDLVLAVVTWVLAAATHPSTMFPFVGVVLAVRLVRPDGRIGWVWPTRSAWTRLWIPLGLCLFAGYVTLALTGHQGALRNFTGRGALATLRLVPAMVQWMTPTAFALGALGAVVLLSPGMAAERRRWGVMTLRSEEHTSE